jgi:hypothetical protein
VVSKATLLQTVDVAPGPLRPAHDPSRGPFNMVFDGTNIGPLVVEMSG